jgi:thiol-disulfide isomerase/thioredoxin
MAPVFDRLAEKYAGNVLFLKLNIENEQCNLEALVRQLKGRDVTSVPAFLLIQNGKEKNRISGSTSQQQFEHIINNTFGLP